jgi:hypothetical protein
MIYRNPDSYIAIGIFLLASILHKPSSVIQLNNNDIDFINIRL